ncbi:hypothetical protein BSY239_2446 [Hydrogenophaga sp. RAC07]|uniref:hypothetical protein n=1 Tax=Hydrogenophaga sp. RAC07 TaxID=1842537 RepID=UPI00083E5565|nr:hypothetical protein [Hydrogenophaga sp. RAC07]AOF84067.1 hypothetical protein BSY239_2446 [Hydrogenophaga sp. RAC07]
MNHAFLARLDELLLPHGFTRAGPAVYRRDWRGGFDAIVPMTVEHPGETQLDFSLNIRQDAVERLLARLDPASRGPGLDTPTTITHMGDIRPRGITGDLRRRLHSPEALVAALDDFVAFLRDAGATHFSRLRDPVAMERAFNADPAAPCVHCRNEVRRVLRGVTLASLHDPAGLDRLVDAYRVHWVKAWDPQRLVPRFEAVVAGLRARAP